MIFPLLQVIRVSNCHSKSPYQGLLVLDNPVALATTQQDRNLTKTKVVPVSPIMMYLKRYLLSKTLHC